MYVLDPSCTIPTCGQSFQATWALHYIYILAWHIMLDVICKRYILLALGFDPITHVTMPRLSVNTELPKLYTHCSAWQAQYLCGTTIQTSTYKRQNMVKCTSWDATGGPWAFTFCLPYATNFMAKMAMTVTLLGFKSFASF